MKQLNSISSAVAAVDAVAGLDVHVWASSRDVLLCHYVHLIAVCFVFKIHNPATKCLWRVADAKPILLLLSSVIENSLILCYNCVLQ